MHAAVDLAGVAPGHGPAVALLQLERRGLHDGGVEHDGLVVGGDDEVHGRHTRVGGHQLPPAGVGGLEVRFAGA